jgi:lysophospholipase L1-like esterase
MKPMRWLRRLALSALWTFGAAAMAAAGAERWIGTWTAAPQPLWGSDFVLPTQVPTQLQGQTVRQVARASLGGSRVRVVLSNEYGTQPLVIDAARVARAGTGSGIVAGTDRPLHFGGAGELRIPPGGRAVSDPVDLEVPALGRLAVSLYLPRPTAPSTFHWDARQTAWVARGNLVGAAALPDATRLTARLFLSALLVDAPAAGSAVVAIGDSITDGNGSTPDTDRRWPDALAQRLAPRGVAVLNAGISGARLLRDGMGTNASARFLRDVVAQPGVKTVIVMLGINDIGWPGAPFAPHEGPVSADELIAGYRQLIAQAHGHGLRIVGATLMPFEGALQGTPLEGHHSPAKERTRQAVNRWIRSSGAFDAVIDFDAITRDPSHPARLLPAFDSGDHLHPGDAGYQAMADAIDLRALLPESR